MDKPRIRFERGYWRCLPMPNNQRTRPAVRLWNKAQIFIMQLNYKLQMKRFRKGYK